MPETVEYLGPLDAQKKNKIEYLGPLDQGNKIEYIDPLNKPSEPSFMRDVIGQTAKDIGKEIKGIPSAVGNAVIGATKGRALPATIAQMAAMPFAGLTALLGYEPGKAEDIGKRYEEMMTKLTPALYPEEQEGMEQIGKLFKPIEMTGEGLKKIVQQTPLKETIAEPIAETVGQAATLGVYGGAGLKAIKARGEAGARGVSAKATEARIAPEKTVPVTPEGKLVSTPKPSQPTPPITPPIDRIKPLEKPQSINYEDFKGVINRSEPVAQRAWKDFQDYKTDDVPLSENFESWMKDRLQNFEELKPAQAPKQPWEMTREEFIKNNPELSNIKYKEGKGIEDVHKDFITEQLTKSHIGGKPVPPEALKDYPDLQKGLDKLNIPPITQEMFSTAQKSLGELRKQVFNVRYGKPGEILFDFQGKTFKSPEPKDVMPVGQGEASNSWALKQILNGNAKEIKTQKLAGLDKLAEEQNKQVQTGAVTLPKKKTSRSPEVSFDLEVEKAYQKSVAQPEPLYIKVKDTFQSIWHKATREYEYLPKNAKFAEARFALKQLEKQKGVAQERTIRGIGETLSGLDKSEYDVFTRKVILNDLTNEATAGHDLPWGLTHESLIKEKIKFDSVVEGSPKVQDALIKRQVMWDNLKNRYSKAMSDIGVDVADKIKNEGYFRHQVLEYVNLNGIFGTGRKLKTPSNRGFLKKRKGSMLDINRDYLQPETEVMAQMNYDIAVAETIKRIDKHYNIADTVRKDAKSKGVENWRDEIPDGYTTWQPREGNVFYMTDSIPSKLADQLKSGALEELGITAEDLRQSLSVGGKRKEFVIPNELAATLDELVKQKTGSALANADRKILKGWKIWTLISPRRYFKYNFRNLTGDADAAFVGNPSGFKKAPQATKELYDVMVNKRQMTPEMQDWFDRGGMQSTLQAQEMGELKNVWMFKRLYEPTKGIKDLPAEVWKKYWKGARISTDIRESILRYANYLDYLEQIKKSPDGKPKNFGGSIPEEIMGLTDPKDKAFWLSNDLLGAYDRVSVMGQNLREYWAPFWSWKEVNFKRYIQFAKNAANDGQLASAIGKKAAATAIKSPYIAYRIGSFLLKATALWSGLQVWNHTRFPEEEKQLSVEERSKPHVILGRDENGKIISFNRLGALGDFLEWFGLDTAPHYVDAWFQGKMTLKDIAKDMAKSPLNVAASVITPFIKAPAELATRRTLYPDVTRPGTIRDRGLYLARNLGLENEYIAITGKPSEGYKPSLTKAFVYVTDPGQVAYSAVFDLKNDFLKKIGKGAEGFWLTPRGNALYNFKLAVRYQDREAADKYLSEYAKLGGTKEGLQRSLQFMNPLSGMSKKEQTVFVLSLNEEDKKTLGRAINFYTTTLLGNNNKEVKQ